MEIIWWLLVIIMEVSLILAMAWHWDFEPTSSWDEYRKQNSGNAKNKQELLRRQIYPIFNTILVFKMMIASGILLCLLQQLWQQWWQVAGLWIGLMALAFVVAKISFVRYQAQNLFIKVEPKLTPILLKIPWMRLRSFQLLTIKPPKLASRAELDYLLTHDQRVMSDTERQIMLATHSFTEAIARDLMVDLTDLADVEASEMLGPLAINELYETGEKLFVVREKRKVIGLINLEELVNLKSGQTFQAGELARQDYLEVRVDDRLATVLTRMLETGTMAALVANEREYLGIIKLETILNQLKITKL